MITSTLSQVLLCLALSTSSGLLEPERQLRIVTAPAPGLGLEAGVGRLDPSDIVRVGDNHFVFYTRISTQTQGYPMRFAGEIWYATSQDGGKSWEERGLALAKYNSKSFDSVGVFAPNIMRSAEGQWLLYYSGAGPSFNFRFEKVGRVDPLHIGVAELSFSGLDVNAKRISPGQAILAPTDRSKSGFDSLRVTSATPLLRNGLYQLYYSAYDFSDSNGSSALGLAEARDASGPYERQHEGRSVFAFSGDVLLDHYASGVIALATSRISGIFWAPDGEHFARMSPKLYGRLNAPGLARDREVPSKLWGLHVARESPHPYLERFDLSLPQDLPLPPPAITPVPRSTEFAKENWLDLHKRSLDALVELPPNLVFLGDGITQGFGGPIAELDAPGQKVWKLNYSALQAVNLGVSGDRTENLLWRLSHGVLDSSGPRHAVLQVGKNNIGRDSAEEIAQGIEAILRLMQTSWPQTKFVVVSILPGLSGDTAWRELIASCNLKLARLARGPHVHFLDLSARFGNTSGFLRAEFFEADRTRLSPSGYQEWASALAPLLDPALEPEGR